MKQEVSLHREARFIGLSMILSLVIGSGAAMMHMEFGILSSILIVPFVGSTIFVYMTILSKCKHKGTNHFALMLIMIIFFFVLTILIS
ncbi:hypothetical protein [Paenibacillus polymyxa]|uniref:hypothetical protein n=1 Tax=Paenibacillus polymyxa TaxID=1406 RepID=UPI000470A09D|nr:hypothetical protein [Paenibacillus polymyxa]